MKCVFIDVDGTLVLDSQEIPASAVDAIKKAQENGHKLFLCTGRSKAELFPNILELGFDGIIGAGGGFVEYEKESILHQHIDDETLAFTLKTLDDNNIDYYIESNAGLFASKGCKNHLRNIMPFAGDIDSHPFIMSLQEGVSLQRSDINKICFLGSHDVPFAKLKEIFSPYYEVHQSTVAMFGETSGELAIKGVSKSKAIDYLLTHMGVDVKDTVAIGDGNNDIDMLEYCALSIAMGNATDDLKAVATWVSSDITEDGLYNAFEYANLLV